ncbi:Ferric reduction oxidase [Vigna angularis]|uniref:ferric-chelate reductase (NADH) n=1 Tax=Phaseolus angularis TaxID=3914 RepID=A0A8T0JPZ8_PHAAN|nr:Ferric reduction oxidase [Vigna angularis]
MMESTYRIWLHVTKDVSSMWNSDEVCRYLHIAIGTAKWQLELTEALPHLKLKLKLYTPFQNHSSLFLSPSSSAILLSPVSSTTALPLVPTFVRPGSNLLMYTFSILLIATLGSNSKKHEVALWKRSVLIKGPLGIVSGTELAFLLMFIALLVWTFATSLSNRWEEKLDGAGLMFGVVGNICLVFMFFPVARGSSVLPLLGLTSESCIKYHIWLGHIAMLLFTAHGLSFIIHWAIIHHLSAMLEWKKNDISIVAGEISLLAGLLLWIATIPRIRRTYFELFYYAHHLYILFVVFFIFHVGISFALIMLPGFYLFMVDRYLRFLQSRRQVRLVSARVLPCEAVELNFSKGHELTYNPTSVMFINVPNISKLQWHPFTVTSNNNLEADKLSVVIKSEGPWTNKLYQLLSTPSTIDHVSVSVEGPYGPASTNYLRHDTLVMVSGGSGITPFISIIRELIHLNTIFKCKTPKVFLICAFKNSSSLSMLELILPINGTPSDISNLELHIEAYITRDKEPKADGPIHPQIRWFKPNPSDEPVHAILGPNSWLWLGAIISSSFVVFLILIGIITRYYIFPIDHNSNKIFSYPLDAFLNMLVICVSIASVSSAAFLWNKKYYAKEGKKIKNMEGSTPTVSPNSMVYNVDRELESLPYQSLIQATNVHYGARPDLKKILFEHKGSSVGVLASGPKTMRHEVAAICSSSGLAENLHFESISFSCPTFIYFVKVFINGQRVHKGEVTSIHGGDAKRLYMVWMDCIWKPQMKRNSLPPMVSCWKSMLSNVATCSLQSMRSSISHGSLEMQLDRLQLLKSIVFKEGNLNPIEICSFRNSILERRENPFTDFDTGPLHPANEISLRFS